MHHTNLHHMCVSICRSASMCALGVSEQAIFKAVEENSTTDLLGCLKSGANINAQDDEGKTPAMWAILRGRREILKILMSSGVDHSTKDTHGQSIFDYLPLFGTLSDERLANASIVIAALSIDDLLFQAKSNGLHKLSM